MILNSEGMNMPSLSYSFKKCEITIIKNVIRKGKVKRWSHGISLWISFWRLEVKFLYNFPGLRSQCPNWRLGTVNAEVRGSFIVLRIGRTLLTCNKQDLLSRCPQARWKRDQKSTGVLYMYWMKNEVINCIAILFLCGWIVETIFRWNKTWPFRKLCHFTQMTNRLTQL